MTLESCIVLSDSFKMLQNECMPERFFKNPNLATQVTRAEILGKILMNRFLVSQVILTKGNSNYSTSYEM